VAQPLGSLSAAKNPAMLANTGTRYDFGLAVFSPNREYTVSGDPSGRPQTFGLAPGTFESGSSVFPLPSLGANWALRNGGALGLGIYGNGGMNTDYDTPTFGFAPTGVDMGQIFVAPTYAHEFASRHSVGVSGIFAMQYFEANGMQAFGQFSGNPETVSNNGRDWSYGYGARLGYLGAWTDQVRIGASFQTRLRMRASSTSTPVSSRRRADSTFR
jgi:long-chain fatty acid transport protein